MTHLTAWYLADGGWYSRTIPLTASDGSELSPDAAAERDIRRLTAGGYIRVADHEGKVVSMNTAAVSIVRYDIKEVDE